MFNTSVIEISKSALEKNLKFIRSQINKKTKISSVIKGHAYGHGIETFVPIAEKCGIDHFSVFDSSEALRVKKISSKNHTIVVMGMIDNDEIEWAIYNNIQFYVFERDRLQAAIEHAKNIGKKAKIHIEFETGMNRTGFNKESVESLCSLLNDNKEHLSIEGVCTHYAGAESIANYLRIQNQIKNFNIMYRMVRSMGVIPKMRHTACSAAAMTYPKTQMDMVRIGILQYGYWPTKETFIHYIADKEDKQDPLERIITWKSKVMSTKEIHTGEFIGYGTTFLAHKKMKIATVPIGYSHGFSRSLSNQGRALVHGKRVSVISIVNMNLIMIDISDVPNVKKGDEVVLIGEQGDRAISVASFSELSDQLNYELLTRLPMDIPRVITS